MAAAYAALISLIQSIEQIQLDHARKSFFSEKQLKQIEFLNEKASFLQDLLERYSTRGNKKAEAFENIIANAGHAAEEIIESYVVDDISPSDEEYISNDQFCEGLHKVIEDMDFVKEKMMEIKDRQPQPQDLLCSGSLTPPPIGTDTMVEFDVRFNQIMDKLTREHSNLQVTPITGMGGIGKTTLAKKAFDHVKKSFDVCAWFTISQVYNIEETLSGIVCAITNQSKQQNLDYHELGKKLHQHLLNRRYLIVMDDLWSTDAWDKLKVFIPDNNNGSRIMVTTRLLNVANYLTSDIYEMNLLDENESWSLLCRKAFGQEDCPHPKLEEVGKRIAQNCKGLPLSIVVIGGLLAKSKMMQELWENVAKDINKMVTSEDKGHSMKILSLSYSHLPTYLKPCFLYMGVYREDYKIRVSKLIKLWVAEGFLKPNKPKSLEEVAKDYLKNLIERNLIMVDEFGSIGTIKTCRIHDLLRDFCVRENHQNKFLFITEINNSYISRGISRQHRIVFQSSTPEYYIKDRFIEPKVLTQEPSPDHLQVPKVLESASYVRSLTCDFPWNMLLPSNFKFLRVFNMLCVYLEHISQTSPATYAQKIPFMFSNLRYVIMFYDPCVQLFEKHRKLETLIVKGMVRGSCETFDIWKMQNLRHLIIDGVYLPDPPPSGLDEDHALENLQTLSRVINFKCTEDVLKRISNIKKLGIGYDKILKVKERLSEYYLNNLERLHKLESLKIFFPEGLFWYTLQKDFIESIVFPHSLKKLTLNVWKKMDLDDVITKIGVLPNLEKLKLRNFISRKEEWNPVEGQFVSLKFLDIDTVILLSYWTADDTHFPVLECLVLKHMEMEIPLGIGDITTLRSIHLDRCSKSTVASAMKILEEQKSYGNDGLRITVSDLFTSRVYE